MNTLFVVNIEKSSITETIGVYETEKEAKKVAKDYTKELKDISFKPNKQEDLNETRVVLFKNKDDSIFITLNKIKSAIFQDKPKTKKQPSPFMIYAKENRKRIVEENPDASFGEIARILGNEWKASKEKD